MTNLLPAVCTSLLAQQLNKKILPRDGKVNHGGLQIPRKCRKNRARVSEKCLVVKDINGRAFSWQKPYFFPLFISDTYSTSYLLPLKPLGLEQIRKYNPILGALFCTILEII